MIWNFPSIFSSPFSFLNTGPERHDHPGAPEILQGRGGREPLCVGGAGVREPRGHPFIHGVFRGRGSENRSGICRLIQEGAHGPRRE